MGFLKRSKKFVAALVLVAALSNACRKELPKEKYDSINTKAAIVERSLKKGEVNEAANKDLVKTLSKLYKEGYKLKGVNFPRDFNEGVKMLNDFDKAIGYRSGDFLSYYDDVPGEVDIDINRDFKVYQDYINFLIKIKNIFGFMPEDEKIMLLNLLKKDLKNTETIMGKKPKGLDFDTEFDFSNSDLQEEIRKNKVVEALNRWIKNVERL